MPIPTKGTDLVSRRLAAKAQRRYADDLYHQGRIDDDTRASLKTLADDYERSDTNVDDPD